MAEQLLFEHLLQEKPVEIKKMNRDTIILQGTSVEVEKVNGENETKEKEIVRGVYEDLANEYDERIPGTTRNDKNFTETEIAFILSKINSSDKVLDMGCGTGRLTIPMAQKARKVTGLDLTAGMLEKSREKAQKLGLEIDFYEADMVNMPFEDNSFDVITCILALMHIPLDNRQKVFVEASRILKPGGRMIVNVKNSMFERLCPIDRFADIDITDVEGKRMRFTNTKLNKELTTPWYSFSPQDLKRFFSIAGLNMIHLKGNIPLSAWLSDNILNEPNIRQNVSSIESILGDIPPFNHFGYYILAEAVKPIR